MAIDFSKVTDIKIPEGNVTKITDTNNTRTIWENNVFTLDFSHFEYAKTEKNRIWFVDKNTKDMEALQKGLKDTTLVGLSYKGTAGVKLLFQNPTAGTYNQYTFLTYGTESNYYEDTHKLSITADDFTLTSSSGYKSFTGHASGTWEARDEYRSLTTFWICVNLTSTTISWVNTKYVSAIGSLKVRYRKSW